MSVEKSRKAILDLLMQKAVLKQDIYGDTTEVFQLLRETIESEVSNLKSKLTDDRIRMRFEHKGDYETHVYVGSDVLVFMMHTNVFLLPETHPYWKESYLKDNPENGFFGIIYMYNFLAQSFIQNRYNDPGYLIGRIFTNKNGHFFIEGKGELGESFTDIKKNKLTPKVMTTIVHTSFAYALDFDLLTPPYNLVAQVNVQQIQQIGASLSIKTGKRLGFQFEAIQEE